MLCAVGKICESGEHRVKWRTARAAVVRVYLRSPAVTVDWKPNGAPRTVFCESTTTQSSWSQVMGPKVYCGAAELILVRSTKPARVAVVLENMAA